MSGQLPSFMLIKDMPNCIEGTFGTFINKMIVMDEVWLALCLGLMDKEEGFINTYTCHLASVSVYKSESERVSERDSGSGDVFVYMLCARIMPLLVRLRGLSNQHLLIESFDGSSFGGCIKKPVVLVHLPPCTHRHLAPVTCVQCCSPPTRIIAAG